LAEASPDEIYRGGTEIAEALTQALNQLFFDTSRVKDVLIISDGGDQVGNLPEAARLAKQKGVRVYSLGIGSLSGSPIPDREGGTIHYQGSEVRSKLLEQPLEQLAQATGGVYVPAQDRRVDLGEFYRDFIETAKLQTGGEEREQSIRDELFIWFLLPAFFLLALEPLLIGMKKRTLLPPRPTSK